MNTGGQEAMATRVDITIPDSDWTSTDDGSVLFTTISVNGCLMHLEAHAVRVEDGVEGLRIQCNDGALSSFESLHAAFECHEALETVTIRGRQYVLFAQAYGE